MQWEPPTKPAEYSESRLIEAILNGDFPIDSNLPAERELATQLGVTRPTLRETLQRLARDGWLEIRHGKPTRVRNYWQEGNLAVLAAISTHQSHLPADFVPNLLTVRQLMAPEYTRLAVERNATVVATLLENYLSLADESDTYAQADFELHRQLTIHSGNPVFTLILNGFQNLYVAMGHEYFAFEFGRQSSHKFYRELLACARQKDSAGAGKLCERIMSESLLIWQTTHPTTPRS